MLWALTKPVFEASTDFGAIAPLIVLTRTNLEEEDSSVANKF